ncbi:MAG: HAMP domain-containing sensor histidine kinase [Bacteroidota bacterium]
MQNQNVKLRLLSYTVIAYMMIGFSWWAILLFTKNRDAFEAKETSYALTMIAEGLVNNEQEFYQSDVYDELYRSYKRQEWMILGESIVFVFSLVIGIWLINRGYHKEVMSAKQRRNFLLSITHELKSPIASIRLVLDTFNKRKLTKDQSQRLTNNALKEVDRLNKLVNDLLLSAKLETAYQLYEEEFNFPELIGELIEQLEAKYVASSFEYEYLDDNFTFKGDRAGLTSVLLNLMENAVKYSPKEAKINVSLGLESNGVEISVADQGIGIEDSEKELIFDKFYRVGSEDTRKTKGTGLGLYIVKQIVDAHGGKIKVSDNKPSGSVFTIQLPLKRASVQHLESPIIAFEEEEVVDKI